MVLSNGDNLHARVYYYLLDFNEQNVWEYIYTNFHKKRLFDLTLQEAKQLFEYATKQDLESII